MRKIRGSTNNIDFSLMFGDRKASTLSVECALLNKLHIENVLDVGCCRGDTLRHFIRKFNPERSFGFEPNSYNFKVARKKSGATEIFNVAVSNYDGEAELLVAPLKGEHSLFSGKDVASKQTVKVVRLDTWAEENDVDNFDFVKIDTQGNDLNVILGMGHILNKIKVLQVEAFFNRDEYNDVPLFSDIMEYLVEQGMRFFNFNKLPYLPTGSIPWCNALFVSQEVFEEVAK